MAMVSLRRGLWMFMTVAMYAALAHDVETLDQENGGLDSNVLFIAKDSTGDARQQLKTAGYKWGDAEGNDDSMVEVVGKHSDREMLLNMGFELIQVHETVVFTKEGYNNPTQIMGKLNKLQADNPKLARVFSITKHVGHSKTAQGREIHAIKLSDNVHMDEDEPNYMLVSNHHARELVTPELALRTAENFVKEYNSGDPKTKKILNENQVYVLYTMNPDGLDSVWKGHHWQRKNSNGVDLNRNYPVGWKMSCGGDPSPSSESFRGHKPLSEVETQTMAKWQADRHFAKVLDVHSNARNLRVNYGCAPLPKKIHAHQAKLGTQVANKMGYPQGQSCCMGGDIHMAYQAHGSLSFLLELGGDSFQPGSASRSQILKETYPGVKHFMGLPISLQGHVRIRKSQKTTDDLGDSFGEAGSPATASIAVEGQDWSLGEQSYTTPSSGRYHLWLPAGKYTLHVKTIGEKGIAKKVDVTVGESGTVHNIYLDPATDMADSKDDNARASAKLFADAPKPGSPEYTKRCSEEFDAAQKAYQTARKTDF